MIRLSRQWGHQRESNITKQPIPATKARATSSAALQHGDLMVQRDRFQQQRGAGSGFASSDEE
jgi:hypothetical protein